MRICLRIFQMVEFCCCPMLSSSACFHHHVFLVFLLVYLPYLLSSPQSLLTSQSRAQKRPWTSFSTFAPILLCHSDQSFLTPQLPEVGCLLWGPFIWSCRCAFEFPDCLCRFSAMRPPESILCYEASALIVSMCWSTGSHHFCTKQILIDTLVIY